MSILYENKVSDRIIFHFNKQSLVDKNVPMWTVKSKGQTWYVNHMESEIGFRTKETPDNSHTQGSLQFVGKLTIEVNGEETIARIKA